ncbi:hypothetical protein WBG78_09910 [Chryseolinea sp. T2]|uniref:XAC2610-related protein n=1 Tax=Chryseolinea sp. T2 TaxID=3129255 RepID=UPI00307807D1
MKANIFSLMIMITLLACGPSSSDDRRTDIQSDSIQASGITKQPKQREVKREESIDSIRLDFALNDAFRIAQAELSSDHFTKQYELLPDDSSFTIGIEISISKLFQDHEKYLLLRRHVPWATYLGLYKLSEGKVEKCIEREQGGMTYLNDTIFDANGDGRKDFLVHWYPSSGCCRRDVYNVYLNQPDNGGFTKDYEFINPTFSPKERIIRGVQYGHPGEVGLYKYRWNGLQVDTLEFIYPDALVKGQFIKTRKPSYRPTGKDGVLLKAVPKEYHSIESYEWFADF